MRWSLLAITAALLLVSWSLVAAANAARVVYYDPTIRDIVARDCSRCHSGPVRNLMSYPALKSYADRGVLGAMVQSLMRQFAGPDAGPILAWIKSGASENPPKSGGGATPAALVCPTPPGGGFQMRQQPVAGSITYTNTIADVLNRDCLRCHLGPFRKLTTYEDVKFYVDNGLLETLVMPGGPMHRFAGPDTKFFMMWIRAGAPR